MMDTKLFIGLFWTLTLLHPVLVCAQSNEPIKPLSLETKLDSAKVALGARLFGDVRLSKNNDVSCFSCHNFTQAGGADSRVRSIGTNGRKGPINSPTVLNSDLNTVQLWSGAFNSLEEQVARVIKNPLVFDMDWQQIAQKLQKDENMQATFAAIYKDGMTEKNFADAIAEFERSLRTPSRFDQFLLGNVNAITVDERRGYEKFKSYGCVACHQGMGVGGNMFQKFGVLGDYFKDRGKLEKVDMGRFNVTNDPADKHVFKVPGLRNVEYTAPYFHDGSAATLNDAVEVMFKYQLGRSAPLVDKELIVRFLKTLSADPAHLKRIESSMQLNKLSNK
jgi:cytochrome c peroxidase